MASDIGEAFRPVVNRRLVTASYGISVAYVVGDIGYEGYRATLDRKDRLQAGGSEQPGAGVEVGLRVARRTGGLLPPDASLMLLQGPC
jgi:fission process protein 1